MTTAVRQNVNVKEIAKRIRYIADEVGLPNTVPPKKPKLSKIIVMRALVLLRAIYLYEMKEGRPPTQTQLSSPKDYDGLLWQQYRELQLEKIRHIPERHCKGPVHIQAAAHLLAEAGLIPPRGRRPRLIEVNGERVREEQTWERTRNNYTLTDEGWAFAEYLFGDRQAHSDNADLRQRARLKGISAVAVNKDGAYYSPLLDFIYKD